MFQLDEWQKQVLETEGNIALRSGRQVGKSTIVSIKAAEYALKNSKKTILIISSVERQAFFLFEKTLNYLLDNYRKEIKLGRERPTKSKLTLRNGSIILSLPTGIDGHGIRGLTIDLLIIDECAFVPWLVFSAVTPMLTTTKGTIILLSTPFGKGTKDEPNYFYERYNDPTFTQFHVSSEDCPRIDKAFLAREKERMTSVQYAQEYLGEFVDELMQFFPTHLIQKCMTIDKRNPRADKRYLGVDIARMGGDETVLICVENHNGVLYQFYQTAIKHIYLTDAVRLIKEVDKTYRLTKIYVDSAGMGAGIYDMLREDEQTKRKIKGIDNAKRLADYEPSMKVEVEERRTKLMKEGLYTNLLRLREQKKIKLFANPELLLSLKSIQYEYLSSGKMRIYGSYSHIAEALVRAAWGIKDKTLSI